MVFFLFLFKQKTAYEMRISDWSSDVCSSDLLSVGAEGHPESQREAARQTKRTRRMRFFPKPGRRTMDYILLEPAWSFRHGRTGKSFFRSEERRVGKECGSKCSSWWSPMPLIKKKINMKNSMITQSSYS